MNITFDSNVQERMINEENHHFVKIKNKICIGEIQVYICEIALSLETIEKKQRPGFFKKYKPNITSEDIPTEDGTLCIRMGIGPNMELHPGHCPKLRCKLSEAQDLGFWVLRMTNFGTGHSKEISDDMYVQHADTEEFWRYAELLASCSDYITGLGCGRAAYNQFKEEFNLVGLGSQAIPVERKKGFSEAIAQWVDSDPLSAHYAVGNQFFCTDDKARNARTKSISYHKNRIQLETNFGIKIISSYKAAQF